MARVSSFVSSPGSYRQTIIDKDTGAIIGSPTTTGGMHSIRASTSRSNLIDSKPVGWLPPTQYTAIFRRFKPVYGSSTCEIFGFPQRRLRIRQGTLNSTVSGFSEVTAWSHISDSYVNECLMEALEELKDQRFNAPIALAERRQTASLFENTAKSLARAYRSFRKGRYRDAARHLGTNPREAGDRWLEFTYGVRPLLSDLHGAVEHLHRSEKIRPPSITVTAAKHTKSRESILSTNGSTYSLVCDTDVWQGCFIRLDYLFPGDFQREWVELGITNPAQIVWEVMPYSFMVDWFVPIGAYLSSLDAALGLQFRGGSLSKLVKVKRRARGGPTAPPVYTQSFAGESLFSRLDRTPYIGSPFPDFPSLHTNLTKEKVASGLAILRQSLSSRSYR